MIKLDSSVKISELEIGCSKSCWDILTKWTSLNSFDSISVKLIENFSGNISNSESIWYIFKVSISDKFVSLFLKTINTNKSY